MGSAGLFGCHYIGIGNTIMLAMGDSTGKVTQNNPMPEGSQCGVI